MLFLHFSVAVVPLCHMPEFDAKGKFEELLHDAMKSGKAVAVYAEPDDFQSYEVGFVDFADGSELSLLCLTPKGEPDGVRLIRLENVSRIDVDTQYTRKLELLYSYRDSLVPHDFPERGVGGARAQLERAAETKTVVHLVDGQDYGPTGYVSQVGDDFVFIDRLGSNGEPDGSAMVRLESIMKVHVGRRQEQVLGFLNRYHHGLKRLLEPES
jgi:hypothetical protein